MTVVNSYIIFQHTREQLQKSITHLAFRRQLIKMSCKTTSVVSDSGGNSPVYQLRKTPADSSLSREKTQA